jgi:hypothetical protein
MRFNVSEQRELNQGHSIVRYFAHPQTGEKYAVDVKRAWNVLYFSCGNGWHRSAREARQSSEALVA